MYQPTFNGLQVEDAIVLACEPFVNVIRNSYMDHVAKTDFVFDFTGSGSAIAVQMKWNGGVKSTFPKENIILTERKFVKKGWSLVGCVLVEVLCARFDSQAFMPAQFLNSIVTAVQAGHNLLKVDGAGNTVSSEAVDMEVYCG